MDDNHQKLIKQLKTVRFLAWIVLIAIAVIFILVVAKAYAIKANQIIKYKNTYYKVIKLNHKKTYAFICPYYNYRNFYYSKDWGWLYGNNCRWLNVLKTEKESSSQKSGFNPKLATNYNYLNSLSANLFKKYYKKMTDIAVMRPTETNIARYTFMTNFMRQKSLQFAYAYYAYILNHPQYDMAGKIGTTSWSYRETSNYSLEQQKRYIHRYLHRLGIFFFFSGKDPYSLKQIPIINWLLQDDGIVVIGVSDDECPSNLDTKCLVSKKAFKYYGVKNVPEIIMVYRKRSGGPSYRIIGSGLTPESTIVSRLFFFLHNRRKIYYKNNNFEKINGTPYMGR